MRDMKIGVVGGGVVGQAIARSYLEYVAEVRVFDKEITKRTHHLNDVMQCDLVFVCLPTPQAKGSLECDTSILEGFFHGASSTYLRQVNYVLRSTVPIGFTKRMARLNDLPNLVHSPEFLTARCSLVDAQIPSRNIVGYQPGVQSSMAARDRLTHLYKQRFPQALTLHMSSDESEAVKLFQNAFFAVKVSFWNECRTLADKLGLDWDTVMEGILSDGRIHPSHTQVPGPDGKRGFGGSCLPKDLASLVCQLAEANLHSNVTHAALLRNCHDRVQDLSPPFNQVSTHHELGGEG